MKSLALIAVAVLAAPAAAQAASPWLHIRVEEPHKETSVRVNLPMGVVEAALAAAPKSVIREGHFQLHASGEDLNVADLRRLWKELKNTGEAELVSVDSKDEKVRVTKKGDLMQIRVQNFRKKEEVHVDVPGAVVDALFSGNENELNLGAAAQAIRVLRGDVVRVTGDDETVRIWVDEVNE